ncbi:MAG: hypothetical protein AAF990_13170 [Bacteroidota bacterium]
MAIISNFELLVKPIAPPVGPGAEIARVVVQGYFLQISNLESRDLKLIFRTRTSMPETPPDSPNTAFTATNNDLVWDITQDNLLQTSMASAGELIPDSQLGHFVNCLPLPAGQTASLALLPRVQTLLPTPADLAIRGFAEIVLSSNVESFNPTTFSAPVSARILVSAEQRGTFIDPQFNPGDPAVQTNLDFDQLAYSINTANGQGEQLLNTHATFENPFTDFLTSDFTPVASVFGAPVSLSQLGSNLSKAANAPTRTTSFKLGNIPVRINYAIKNGKFIIEEDGINKALTMLKQRRKIAARQMPTTKGIAKRINAALSGNKRAEATIQKLFEKIS